MNHTAALNIVLGSVVLTVLMFIDYARKYNTDAYQRGLFLNLLAYTFAAMCADFTYFLVSGVPGRTVYIVLHISLIAYYTSQFLAYFYVCLFVDYITFKNQQRTGAVILAAWVITAAYFVSLFFNLWFSFYYSIDPGNVFTPGHLYIVRFIVCFVPVFFSLFDIFSVDKAFRSTPLALTLLFAFLTCVGSALDVFFQTSSLVWPCFVTALLYAYFFIVRNDSKIDSLTGLGNRYSFNEFIDKLANAKRGEFRPPFLPKRRVLEPGLFKKKPPKSYSVVMIDMDHFKEINDTLGHLEGDNALRDMASIIKGCIRHSDFAARYGGDEFVLAARTEYDIGRVLERMMAAIDELNEKKERPYKLEISYGWDIYTVNSGVPVNEFLQHIDGLMYKHKNERRRIGDRNGEAEDAAILP